MAVSKPQQIAVLKYRAKAYDRISIDVPKGKREEYNQSAAKLKTSLAKLIQVAVEEYTKKEGIEIPLPTPEAKSLSPADERLLDEFSKLPADAKKHLVELAKIINQKGDS